MTTEEEGLVDCCAVWLLNCFPTFRLQGYESIQGLITPNDKGSTSLRNVGKQLPTHTVQRPRRLFLNEKTSLQLTKSFSAVSFSAGWATNCLHDLGLIFRSILLFVSLVIPATRPTDVLLAACHGGGVGGILNGGC